jgi:hypothetical protein
MLDEHVRAEIRRAVEIEVAKIVAIPGADTQISLQRTAKALGVCAATLANHVRRGTIPQPEIFLNRRVYQTSALPELRKALEAFNAKHPAVGSLKNPRPKKAA